MYLGYNKQGVKKTCFRNWKHKLLSCYLGHDFMVTPTADSEANLKKAKAAVPQLSTWGLFQKLLTQHTHSKNKNLSTEVLGLKLVRLTVIYI